MNRIPAAVSTLVILTLTVALMSWMFSKIAEYPGLPRDVSQGLPAWFTALQAVSQPLAAGTPTNESSSSSSTGASEQLSSNYVQVTGDEIEIVLKEYKLVPDKIMVGPGKVTFVLRNEGRFSHDFHIEGPGVDVRAAKFGPGRSIRVEVTLQEGEYKISCPLSNHDERGMHGTVLVTFKSEGD